MKQLAKYLIIFSLTIGFIALGINNLFGEGTASYITTYQVNGQEYKIFDFYKYITTISTNFTDLSYLDLQLPNRTWANIESNILQGDFWADLGNNLALMLDYIIMGINILMYPFKITGYILKCVLGILGINTLDPQGNMYWLINFANMVQSLAIPYV